MSYFHAAISECAGSILMKKLPNISRLLWLLSKSQDLRDSALFAGIAVLLAVTCLWTYRQYMHSAPFVDPEIYPVRGIDVSAHNGFMNLDAAASSGI